jgi:hypothetical protein
MAEVWRPSSRSTAGWWCCKILPVVTVVTNEVRDLAEGLVCDDVLEGHGDGFLWVVNVEVMRWRCVFCVEVCVFCCV